MRGLKIRASLGAAVVLVAVVLSLCSRSYAQIGFEAYGGGTLPAGEFGKTDISRRPPKSGAENGHAVGGGLAWGFRWGGAKADSERLHPVVIITLGYEENQFGNYVPVSVYSNDEYGTQFQFATPESGIRMRGLRFGLRMIPWGERRITPTFGGGFERLKIKVDSRTFFGPGPQPGTNTAEPTPIHITNESGNILGAFMQGGITVRSNRAVVLFGDLVYHMLFSDGVSTVTTVAYPTETLSEKGKIKSNFQWWEVRGGLIFLVGR